MHGEDIPTYGGQRIDLWRWQNYIKFQSIPKAGYIGVYISKTSSLSDEDATNMAASRLPFWGQGVLRHGFQSALALLVAIFNELNISCQFYGLINMVL